MSSLDVRADGWDIRGRWVRRGRCGHTAAGSIGARRDDSMARGRDLDRTARNAVTGVDQRRIVADYAIELPLFREQSYHTLSRHNAAQRADLGTYRA
jgi:hypothetical protein